MALRLVILALVGGGAWYLSAAWQRRRGSDLGFPPGVTLITGPGCSLCGPLEAALRRAGVVPVVRDISTVESSAIRSLPTLIVVDDAGDVVLRRSGRLALDDVAVVAARVGRSTGGPDGR